MDNNKGILLSTLYIFYFFIHSLSMHPNMVPFSLVIAYLCGMFFPFVGKDMHLLKGISTDGCWGVGFKFCPLEAKKRCYNHSYIVVWICISYQYWNSSYFVIVWQWALQNHITRSNLEEFGNLKSLISMDLYNNNITGEIPRSLGNLKSLVFLWVFFLLCLHGHDRNIQTWIII